jgi:nuclear pore complex protein Nup205
MRHCMLIALADSLEMLLLLMWRHLAVYGDTESDIGNLRTTIRIASSFNAESFRTDASRKLAPIIRRLSLMVCSNLDVSAPY